MTYGEAVTFVDSATRLGRLGVLLELRGGVSAPVLAAAMAAPSDRPILVGAAAHGGRLDLVIPATHDTAVAVGLGDGASDATAFRIRLDGAQTSVALARAGAISPRAAVDEIAAGAPAATIAAWFDLVDQLCAIAGGAIAGRSRGATGGGSIAVRYPVRDAQAEIYLIAAVDQLAAGLGSSAAQRRLWQRIHPQLGAGREVTVESQLVADRVSQRLVVGYPVTDWATAIRLAEGLVLDPSEAAEIPKRLGAVAGALDSDKLESLEIELGPHEPPEVVVWAKLAPTG